MIRTQQYLSLPLFNIKEKCPKLSFIYLFIYEKKQPRQRYEGEEMITIFILGNSL